MRRDLRGGEDAGSCGVEVGQSDDGWDDYGDEKD